MNNRIAAAAALTLTAALALTACAPASNVGAHDGHGMKPSATASTSNSADVMFAAMMIPHHQQAVEMSDIVLAKSDVTPEVADLARAIKAAQAPEIEKMRSWLASWGADESMPMDHAMDGMMSPSDLAALKDAGGPEASRLFLTQMIAHHEGAVAMAKTEIDNGKNPDAVALARAVVAAQQAEIAQMKQLLGR
ncbi:DUF305 domain-containing protein [Microbacterium candidum]|uniref:DUF305 domain-containing protein n=1 Tax=Microbacterium candidum TaxID=3041922 RepID=A0ABT7MUW0_9MICO|nr:DUF305 domain-containing protein [Microbacterium sp. ASV49]MDL9978229.1 DUF305 domain-containing protein [Microbacterium sp. ASV49]